MQFCVPAGEVSLVRFYKVLIKSNDLIREGIFNHILDYLCVYQKEKKKKGDSYGWFTVPEKPEFSHSFLAKT